MKLKKVATITQEEVIKNKELKEEAEELVYAIHKYNIKQRKFVHDLFEKYLDSSIDPKPYLIRGRGIYTND